MGNDRLIYFRTDGNRQIASGHLVRCLSVAFACLQLDMKVCFLISDRESQDLLTGILRSSSLNLPASFSVIRLKTAAFDHPDQELPEVLSLLTPVADCAVYFLDSYYVTKSYLSALRPLIKIAYLDDLKLFDYPVDLLINYDIVSAKAMPAFKSSYRNATRLLLGASYTPLRVQFQNKETPVREQASHILITTGASDPYHFCLKFINKICDTIFYHSPDSSLEKNKALIDPKAYQSLTLHIVIGKFNTDKEILRQLAREFPCLMLHENISDMASLMQTCDLAVSAAGTTLYELCALGLPAISFTMADNQLSSARAFEDAQLIPCAGDIRDNPESVFQAILKFLTSMSLCLENNMTKNPDFFKSYYSQRTVIHTRMRQLIDGKGAYRIALSLRELAKEHQK